MKAAFLLVAGLLLVANSNAQGVVPTASQSSALVDAQWLAQRLDHPDVRILEIGDREQYDVGHLPQAVFVDWIKDITDSVLPERYNILSREQFEALLSRLGIQRDTTVVVYDAFEGRLATRMFWTLRFYGHQPVKILDGGEQAWLRARRNLVTDVPNITPTNYRIEASEPTLGADRQFIRSRMGQSRFVLIDGRPVDQYTGKLPGRVYHTGKEHARRGHIPRAVNIPWQENLAADGTFKSVSELRNLYNRHGVTPAATVVTYCNEGLHAAHPWFVLTELLGQRDVRVYDDSLSEWANAPDDPLVVGNK